MTVHAAASAVAEASHSVWWPTRKWWAATIVAFGGFLSTFATQDWHWTPAFAGAVITIATQRLVAYVVKNDDTPGGAPNKRAGNGRGRSPGPDGERCRCC